VPVHVLHQEAEGGGTDPGQLVGFCLRFHVGGVGECYCEDWRVVACIEVLSTSWSGE
jgi:hypothetical protein